MVKQVKAMEKILAIDVENSTYLHFLYLQVFIHLIILYQLALRTFILFYLYSTSATSSFLPSFWPYIFGHLKLLYDRLTYM